MLASCGTVLHQTVFFCSILRCQGPITGMQQRGDPEDFDVRETGMSDSYGEAFGRRLGAGARSFTTRALPKSLIAVTELRYSNPQMILSVPPVPEDAYLVAVHFELFEKYEYWENGKAAPRSVLRPGESIIYDIKRTPTFHLNSRFHSVHFYFPTAVFRMLAEQAGARSIQELRYVPGVSHDDRVLTSLASGLLPIFRSRNTPNRLFLDHLMLAAGYHVAARYGGLTLPEQPPRGGLSRRQEQLAKEMIMADLGGDISLAELAEACGLSLSQFSKAFRRTTGTPPHRWLLQQRIEKAKALLGDEVAIAEIALLCGFADQSHFTRSFTAAVGVSPRAWRRSISGY